MMDKGNDKQQRKAKQGEKMIELRIRFWTNDLAEEKDNILPKHAWSSGMVMMDRNESHGIVPNDPVPFNSLMSLPWILERVLIAHGITLHASPKMKKYLKSEK
jgi:hypothetical protein